MNKSISLRRCGRDQPYKYFLTPRLYEKGTVADQCISKRQSNQALAFFTFVCLLTISLIHMGANGEVQPFETG
jgi:hypothetical protein